MPSCTRCVTRCFYAGSSAPCPWVPFFRPPDEAPFGAPSLHFAYLISAIFIRVSSHLSCALFFVVFFAFVFVVVFMNNTIALGAPARKGCLVEFLEIRHGA